MAGIEFVVLDFDGTCTRIEEIQESFLVDYGAAQGAPEGAWAEAVAEVRAAAPAAGWTLFEAPGTAPAGADPFILSFEAARLLVRRGVLRDVQNVFSKVYNANIAPHRPELLEVLVELVGRGVRVGFISNSDQKDVAARIDGLGLPAEVRAQIHVEGGASKMKLYEPPFEGADARRKHFAKLPGAAKASGVKRPIYLRRGYYFEALCRFFDNFGEHRFPIAKTLVVGDIYELDLAMPQALGAKVHLIERAKPFPTYKYERAQLAKPKHASKDLRAILKRV